MTLPRTVLLAVCGALAMGACGNNKEPTSPAAPTPAQTTEGAASAEGPSGGERCQDVTVPGHKAVDVRSEGAECGAAEKIAAAAEGRGRTAYESGGFACTPSDASGGDTTYRCTMGPATITFLYGTT